MPDREKINAIVEVFLSRKLEEIGALLSADEITVGELAERWRRTGELSVAPRLRSQIERLLIEWHAACSLADEIAQEEASQSKSRRTGLFNHVLNLLFGVRPSSEK